MTKIEAGNRSLGWRMTGTAAVLAAISIWMNVTFGQSLGIDEQSRYAMGGQYLFFDLAKLLSLSIAGYAITKRHYAVGLVFIIIFSATVMFSLISTQSFMSSLLYSQKTERIQESEAYKDNQAAKHRVQRIIDNQAISANDMNEAERKKNMLVKQINNIEKMYDRYVNLPNYPTKAQHLFSEMTRLDKELMEVKLKIKRGEEYKAALETIERLESKKFEVAEEVSENPGFSSVARMLGININTFKDILLFAMAVTSELITASFFAYVGFVKGTNPSRKITALKQDVVEAKQEVEAEEIREHINTILSNKSTVDSKTIDDDDKHPYNTKTATKDSKSKVGSKYKCIHEECKNTFIARTQTHKQCSECRTRRHGKRKR